THSSGGANARRVPVTQRCTRGTAVGRLAREPEIGRADLCRTAAGRGQPACLLRTEVFSERTIRISMILIAWPATNCNNYLRRRRSHLPKRGRRASEAPVRGAAWA